MKGLLYLTTSELASLFIQANSQNYDRITRPLYYREEGPYLFTMDMKSSHPTIYLYEILDIETCLANPQKFPAAFDDDDFLIMALTALGIDDDENPPEKPAFQFRKLVPRTSNCKQHAKEIYQKCPEMTSRVFFMASSGILESSLDLLTELLVRK